MHTGMLCDSGSYHRLPHGALKHFLPDVVPSHGT
jgi:hypothetical protein